ncbi:MAG: M14 family metallopeptidase [Cyclobacteriaceae bacterium]
MKKFIFPIILQLLMMNGVQSQPLHEMLNESYANHKEASLNQRRFKHQDITPLLERVKSWDGFSVEKVGKSLEGRPISLVSFGDGEKKVLLWSQMHGDEATATQALFDIFNFLRNDEKLREEITELSRSVTLHFIPMLNPDGAERFQRRNAQNIDINRDALRLQTPEGRLLQRVHDSLGVSFGFNLHDQSRYYNVEGTSKPASISVLAPAFNEEKDINEVRSRAMKLIVQMNKVLQVYAPGQVGRYSDDFEPRAFGDNIQSWGTSTILIESGGYPGDREKQEIRKLNYLAILEALFAISSESYEEEKIGEYEEIPKNASKMFDLKLSNVRVMVGEKSYIADIGIDRNEIDKEDHLGYTFSANVDDYGDLSTHYGYEDFNAEGYTIEFGRITDNYKGTFSDEDILELLRQGVAYVRMDKKENEPVKINRVGSDFEVPESLEPGSAASFFLRSSEGLRYAVINGFLVDLDRGDLSSISNAIDYYEK